MKPLAYFLIVSMGVSITTPVYAQDFDNRECNDKFIDDPAPRHRALENLETCEDKADSENIRRTLYFLGGLTVAAIIASFFDSDDEENGEVSFMELHTLLDEVVVPKVSYDPDTETTHFGWTIPLGE